MEMYVDGHMRTGIRADEITLHDALEPIREENAQNGRAIIGLSCDGRDVLTELLHGVLDEPVGSFDRIEVETGSPQKLIAQALMEARETLAEADNERHEIVALLGAGQHGKAVSRLGGCLGRWWQTNEAISKSLALLGVIGEDTEGAWGQLSGALEPVTSRLADIRDAVQAQDYVSLADTLEYEFAEVTQAWNNVIESVLDSFSEKQANGTMGPSATGRPRQPQPGEPATTHDPDVNSL